MGLEANGCMWNASIKSAGAVKVAASRSLVGEVNIRAQNFSGFLPKSESIYWLILYEAKSSFSSHAIISASVNCVSFFSNNTLCNNLAMIYLCCFYTHISDFDRLSRNLHW